MDGGGHICKQCKKEIVKSVFECQLCNKQFHQSCARTHKIYNGRKELVKCQGRIEEKKLSKEGGKPSSIDR